MKKHILVISQYFHPEQFRINDICAEWVDRGYKVTVITGIPNYPQGKYYKGYGIFSKKNEVYNGINIIRIPLVPRGKNPLMLILNYISFVISGGVWFLLTKIKADLVFIFEVSPMTQALPGVWYAKKRNIPCYLYVQDLWPENVEIVTGITNKVIINSIGRMVDYIYSRCSKIFTTSSSFIKSINERGVPIEKLIYWPQYAEDFYQPQAKLELPDIKNDNIFNIVFTGNIGKAQGLEILPDTAVILKSKKIDKKICFNIVGDGRYKEELINLVSSKNVSEMFNFIQKQPPENIPKYLGANDAAFLCLKSSKLFAMTIPAKLQSYLACGIPVIASVDGEAASIISQANAGLFSMAGDAEKLSEIIIKMSNNSTEQLRQYGINARKYYDLNFNKTELFDRMDYYFNEG